MNNLEFYNTIQKLKNFKLNGTEFYRYTNNSDFVEFMDMNDSSLKVYPLNYFTIPYTISLDNGITNEEDTSEMNDVNLVDELDISETSYDNQIPNPTAPSENGNNTNNTKNNSTNSGSTINQNNKIDTTTTTGNTTNNSGTTNSSSNTPPTGTNAASTPNATEAPVITTSNTLTGGSKLDKKKHSMSKKYKNSFSETSDAHNNNLLTNISETSLDKNYLIKKEDNLFESEGTLNSITEIQQKKKEQLDLNIFKKNYTQSGGFNNINFKNKLKNIGINSSTSSSICE